MVRGETAMLLRIGVVLAVGVLACGLAREPSAQPLERAAENPFVLRRAPLDTRIEEWRAAMRLSGEQAALFAEVEALLRKLVRDRDASVVAAAIDRNRQSGAPRDPGEALRAKAERLSRHVENLRALADAETSFFGSLSDEQRRIADRLLPKDLLGGHDPFRRRGPRPRGSG